MNKAKGLMVGAFLITAILVFFANQGISQAADAKLIKIQAKGGDKVTGFYLDPATVTIDKNTIIVWMSGVPGREVQVVFQEGKTCRDITANPNTEVAGFYMDSKNCYVTSFLPYSATSTLQFPEVGHFEYKVVSEDGKMQAEGKVIVKHPIPSFNK